MFKRVYCQFLMTFEDHEIVAVALVVPEEKILAMDGVYILPVLQSELDGRKGRMGVKLVAEAVLLKEVQDLGNSFISARSSSFQDERSSPAVSSCGHRQGSRYREG